MKGFLKTLIEEISNTSIKYWTNSDASLGTIITLLTTSTLLLILARWPWHGKTSGEVDLIIAMLAIIMQLFACLAYLLRGGYGNAKYEVPKFLRLLVVIWILSLFFSLHNLFPPLSSADYFHPLITAGIYSFLSVILLAYVTVCREGRDDPSRGIDFKNIIFWSIFVGAINTILFFVFVIDWQTTYFIKSNLASLKTLISKYI